MAWLVRYKLEKAVHPKHLVPPFWTIFADIVLPLLTMSANIVAKGRIQTFNPTLSFSLILFEFMH